MKQIVEWNTSIILTVVFSFAVQLSLQNDVWKCKDVLHVTICKRLRVEDNCDKISAIRGCQKRCGYCDEGISWTRWTQWSECSSTKCGTGGRRTRVRLCHSLKPCLGSTIDIQPCTRSNCTAQADSEVCDPSRHFVCPGNPVVTPAHCLNRSWICDGFKDCADNVDEQNCLVGGGPTDAFQVELVTDDNVPQCLHTDKNVTTVAWHCSTPIAPYYFEFRWKWHGFHNLRNVADGRCMGVNSDTKDVEMQDCDADNPFQHWDCDEDGGLALPEQVLRRLPERFLSFSQSDQTNRAVVIASRNRNVVWKVLGSSNDNICMEKRRWSDWSQWSECSSSCIAFGYGVRTRRRVCKGGDSGRGLCFPPAVETQTCSSRRCLAQCPPGFSNATYAWSCVKVVTDKLLNLTDAQKSCQSMKVQGVSLNAVLASDKDKINHEILKNLSIMRGVPRMYIGVSASVVNGQIERMEYVNDNQPVGDLVLSRSWHHVSMNLTGGWPGSQGAIVQIVSGLGYCLSINITTHLGFLEDCSLEETYWVAADNLLMHLHSYLCLAREEVRQRTVVLRGKRCDMKDAGKDLKWTLKGKYIMPINTNYLLSILSPGKFHYRKQIMMEWFLGSLYNGPTNMFQSRDWYGKWFSISFNTDGLCLTVVHYIEKFEFHLKRLPCDVDNSRQRWSLLWSKHLVNRQYVVCLAVNITAGSRRVNNDTSVLVAPCLLTERSQVWRKILVKKDNVYYSKIFPLENLEVTLQSKCKPQSVDSSGVCVAKTDGEEDNLLTTRNKPSSSLGEIFQLHSRFINELKFCLRTDTKKFPVDDTPVVIGECSENIEEGSWWRWAAAGTAIVNHACSVDDCCLTAATDGALVLRNCSRRVIQREQMWRIVKGERGFFMTSLKEPSVVVGLTTVLFDLGDSFTFTQSYIESGGVTARAVNMEESYWYIKEDIGGHGNISGLTDCWKKGDKDFVYSGSRTWTAKGRDCQSWIKQTPHPHNYPSDGPYCRNPPSFRPDGSEPWCLTTIPTVRWESCQIPECPVNLGVILSSEDGMWTVSGGTEKLPYACEVHPECKYGAGFFYEGTINASWTGRNCLNWKSRQIRLNQEKSGIIAPNHSFCRNPNHDEKGPWCWVTDFDKEYCSHILPCPILCHDPPALFRGFIRGIFHAGTGVGYANGSTLLYGCKVGYERTQKDAKYDLQCIDGEWFGRIPTCIVTVCDFPAKGVINAEPLYTAVNVVYKGEVVYQCFQGYILDEKMDSITFKCGLNNTWSTELLPERFVQLDNMNIKDVSNISCITSCLTGFMQVGRWCMQVKKHKDFYAGDARSMTCDPPSRMIPLEAALPLDMQAMLKSLAKERFQFHARKARTKYDNLDRFGGLTLNESIFRSSMSGELFEPDVDYVPSRFMIKTYTHIRINLTIFRQYCIAALTPEKIVPLPCPTNYKNKTFLFRWISDVHILHLGFKMCLTAAGIGSIVRLRTCSITNNNQQWLCEAQRLYFVSGIFRGVLHVSIRRGEPFLSIRSHIRLPSGANLTSVANKFYGGEYLIATLGIYKALGICNSFFKPVSKVFRPVCFKSDADSFLDTRRCILKKEYTFCPYFYSEIHFIQSLFNGLICDRPNVPVVTVGSDVVTLGEWCLTMSISRDSLKSQVMEAPCSSFATNSICVMKALHSCESPVLRIKRGYRVSGRASVVTENLIYTIMNKSASTPTSYTRGAKLTYRCDDGYRFSDGTIQQEMFCLKDGTWSRDAKKFECVPRHCWRPEDPLYARPFFIQQNTSELSVGTILQVSCQAGYVIGESTIVNQVSVCSINGEWEPPIARCRPMSCEPPPKMEGMVISGNVFRLHGTVIYKCDYGRHFLLTSGATALQSVHKCDSSGAWVPSPYVLQCIDARCPVATNVLTRSKSGVLEVVTIGCTGGDFLYDGNVAVPGGKVTAICNPEGRWEPNVANLRCDYTICPLPIADVKNARVLRWWNNLPDRKNDFYDPVHEAKAELVCSNGYHQMHHFSIYNGVPSGDNDEGCLGVDEFSNRVTLSPVRVCEEGDDASLLWQWWPHNNSLLMNVNTGLCLTSSLPAPNIRRSGFGNVTMEHCYAGNERQRFTCYGRNANSKYVGLQGQEYEQDGEVVLIRYHAPLQTVIMSTSFSLGNSEWRLNEGSAICVMKSPDMKTEVKCSRNGVWVPDASQLACVPTVCQLPAKKVGIIFHSAKSSSGAKIPLRNAHLGFAYGSSVVATCAEGYKVKDPFGEGKLSTVVITCSAMQQWNPTLKYMDCEPIVCESLAGKIANARLKTVADRTRKWQYLSSVTVICKQGMWFENEGIRSPSLTLDCGKDGAWGWPPHEVVCKPVRCSKQPPVPEKASIISKGIGYAYNDARIMRCLDGFWFGRDRQELTVRCLDDGQWHPKLKCIAITCFDPPPYISFGRILSSTRKGWEIGMTAVYRCIDHRRMYGTNNLTMTVTCGEDGIWDPDPRTLACTLYGCLSIEEMQKINPHSAVAGGHSDVGASLNVSCERGYIMRNGLETESMLCRDDRQWFPPLVAVKCLPVSCGGTPPSIPRAVTKAQDGYAYGSIATVTCNKGYIMEGVDAVLTIELKCNVSGLWNPDPHTLTCVNVTCIDPRAKPHTIFTRINTGGRRIAEKGDLGILSCSLGFWLDFRVYSRVLTCSDSGLWYPHPESIPCIPINCFDPGLLRHSTRRLVGADARKLFILSSGNIDVSKGYKYMQQLEYKCDPGYWAASGIDEQRTLCQQNGEWTHNTGTLKPCVPISCAKLPVIKNADIIELKYAYNGIHGIGAQVTYKCRLGYYFLGDQSSTLTTNVVCSGGGTWEPSPATLQCFDVTCPYLDPLYQNNSNSNTYGSVVTVTCPVGYVLDTNQRKNSQQLTCTADGTWQPTFVRLCERLTCRDPPVYANARRRPLHENNFLYGTYWIVTCELSFSVSLSNNSWEIRCSEDGTWQPNDMQCIRDNYFRCDLPPRIQNSRRTLPDRYLHQSIVTYTCHERYWMANKKTSQILVCNEGDWVPDPSTTVCHPVTCTLPVTPLNVTRGTIVGPIESDELSASLLATGQTYYGMGTTIHYLCKVGLWNPGVGIEITSVCTPEGFKPHPNDLKCTKSLCKEDLPTIQQANIATYINSDKLPEARYRCDAGYILSPSRFTRTRDFTTACVGGIWVPSPTQRLCIPLMCQVPPDISFGYYTLGSIYYLDTVPYNCISGFRFTTNKTTEITTCNDHGDWDPEPSTSFSCVVVDCGSPMELPFTTVTYGLTTYQMSATYTCDHGKKIEKTTSHSVTVKCEGGRRWMPQPSNVARCVNGTCSEAPPFVNNTQHDYGFIDYGATWTYECLTGFHVSPGQRYIYSKCNFDGTWETPQQRCVPSDCGLPPFLDNSKITDYHSEIDPNGGFIQNVSYECDKGFWISDGIHKSFSAVLHCDNGEWSPNPDAGVRCVIVTCDVLPTPRVIEGLIPPTITRTHAEEDPRYGAKVVFDCPFGQFIKAYRMRSLSTDCQADGRWSRDVTKLFCEETSCPETYNDTNAVWTHNSYFNPGAKSEVSCKTSFWLSKRVSTMILTCSEDGRWEPEDKCLPIECPDPQVEHSWYNVSTQLREDARFPVMSQVNFTCFPGYNLLSSTRQLICELSGEWNPSHTTVRCRPITCPMPYVSETALLVGAQTYNSTLFVKCKVGYMIETGVTFKGARCQANGEWDNDLTSVVCFPVYCYHSKEIENGTLISANPTDGPNFQHRQIVRIACHKGYWTDRNIRQFSAECTDRGLWYPPLDDVKCSRISCIEPFEKNSARKQFTSLIAGSRLTYACDPLHWVAILIPGRGDDPFDRWNVTTYLTYTLLCLEGGEWHFDQKNLQCLSSKGADTYTVRNDIVYGALSSEQTDVLPLTGFSWLSKDTVAAVNGPGKGTELGEWIERVEGGERGRIFKSRGMEELREALDDPNYRSVMEEILRTTSFTSINCSEADEQDYIPSNITEEEMRNFVPMEQTDPIRKCQSLSKLRLLRRARMLKTLSRDDLEGRINRILDARYKKIALLTGRSVGVVPPKFSSFVGSNKTFLYDGDPLTTWTPNEHAVSWQFEFHLGSLYLIDEVMLISANHTLFNLSFSSVNQTFHSTKFFLINTRTPNSHGNVMQVTVTTSVYGHTIRMRNFGRQQATLIHFSFDLPPFVREVNFHGAKAKWQILVSLESLRTILVTLAAMFITLLPVLMIFDYRHAKECTVEWFGGLHDGIPCIIKIQTADCPKIMLDLYVRVITSRKSSTPVAWLKIPAKQRGILSNNLTIGFFTPRPETNHVGVYIACNASDRPEGTGADDRKLTKWEVEEVGAVCAGREWSNCAKASSVTIRPFQRFGFSLELQKRRNAKKCMSWLTILGQHHMLSFVRPLRPLFSYQYLTLSQRLHVVFASASATMLIMSVLHVFTDVAASDAEGTSWFQNSIMSVSTHSGVCVLIALCMGVAILLGFRLMLVAFSKHERYMKLCGKARTAVLRLPGKSLYNIIMTGNPAMKNLRGGRGSSFKMFADHLLPSHSTMMAWLMERNFFCMGVYKSRSAPVAIKPSSGVADTDILIKDDQSAHGNNLRVNAIGSEKTLESLSFSKLIGDKHIQPSHGCGQSSMNMAPKRMSTVKHVHHHARHSHHSSSTASSSGSRSGSYSGSSSGSGSTSSSGSGSSYSGSTDSSELERNKSVSFGEVSSTSMTSGKVTKTNIKDAKKKHKGFFRFSVADAIKAAKEKAKKKKQPLKKAPSEDSGSTRSTGSTMSSSGSQSTHSDSGSKSTASSDEDESSSEESEAGTDSTFDLPKIKKKKVRSSTTMETSLHTSDMTVDSSMNVTLRDDAKIITDLESLKRGDFTDYNQMGDGLRTKLKGYIVSRPTASQLQLAVGRRTIFPQKGDIAAQASFSDLFFTFTAGSLLLATISVLTSIIFAVCYFLVDANKTGPEAKFLLDGVVLVTILFFLLGTSIEALLISLLIYCGLVEHDIDFEDEVSSIMRKYQHLCSKVCTDNYIDQEGKPNAKQDDKTDQQIVQKWKKQNEQTVATQAELGMTLRQARDHVYKAREAILRCGATVGPCRTHSCPGTIPCHYRTCSLKQQAQNAACCAEIQVEIDSSDTHTTTSEDTRAKSESSRASTPRAKRSDVGLFKSFLPCDKVSKWIGDEVKWLCVIPKYKPLRPGQERVQYRAMLPLEQAAPWHARRTYCRTTAGQIPVEASTYQTTFNLPRNVCDVCETGNLTYPPTFYSQEEHVTVASQTQKSNTVKLSAFSSTRVNAPGKEMLMAPHRFATQLTPFQFADKSMTGNKEVLRSLVGNDGRISKQYKGKNRYSGVVKQKFGESKKKKRRKDSDESEEEDSDDDGHSLHASKGTTPSRSTPTSPSILTSRNTSSPFSSFKTSSLKHHTSSRSSDDVTKQKSTKKRVKYETGPEIGYSSESRYESADGDVEQPFSGVAVHDGAIASSSKEKKPGVGNEMPVSILATPFSYSRYVDRFISALKAVKGDTHQQSSHPELTEDQSGRETGMVDAMKVLEGISEQANAGGSTVQVTDTVSLDGYSEREKGYIEALKVLQKQSTTKPLKKIARKHARESSHGSTEREKGFAEAMKIVKGSSDNTRAISSSPSDAETGSTFTYSDHEKGFIEALKVMHSISEEEAQSKRKSILRKKKHRKKHRKKRSVRVRVVERSADGTETEDPTGEVTCKVTSRHKLRDGETDSSSKGRKKSKRRKHPPSSTLTSDTSNVDTSTSGYLPQTDETRKSRKRRKRTSSGEERTSSKPAKDAKKSSEQISSQEDPAQSGVHLVRATVFSAQDDEETSSDVTTSTIVGESQDQTALSPTDMFPFANLNPFSAMKNFLTQTKIIGSPANAWGPSSGDETSASHHGGSKSDYETGSSTSAAPIVLLHDFQPPEATSSKDSRSKSVASSSTAVRKSKRSLKRKRSKHPMLVNVNTVSESVPSDSQTPQPYSSNLNASSSSHGQRTSFAEESEDPSIHVTVNTEPFSISSDALPSHQSPAVISADRYDSENLATSGSTDFQSATPTSFDDLPHKDSDESNESEHSHDDTDDSEESLGHTDASTAKSTVSSVGDLRALRNVFSEIKHVLVAGITNTKSRLSVARASLEPAAGVNVEAQSAILSCLSRTEELTESLLPSLVERGNDAASHNEVLALKDELDDVKTKAAELLGVERSTTFSIASSLDYQATDDLVQLRKEFNRVRMTIEQALNDVIKSDHATDAAERTSDEDDVTPASNVEERIPTPVIWRSAQFFSTDETQEQTDDNRMTPNVASVVNVLCYTDESERD